MKRILAFLFSVTIILVSACDDYSLLTERVDDLENRVAKLEELCNRMNTNISSLQTIVTALQQNDHIINVAPITEDSVTIGYIISFTKSSPITIYYGRDVKEDYAPIIGVRQDRDGIYYWTINGEWLLDENGNKITTANTDGKDGQDGNYCIPLLKIENDYWYISYDNETTWVQLGKAICENGNSFFQSVTQDENNVYFTLADGTVITVPKDLELNIEFAESELVVMPPNSTREIGYIVTSATDSVNVEVTSSADIKAKVVADDKSGLSGKIIVNTGTTIDEYCKVIVFVSNGHKVIMRSIKFEDIGLTVEENATKQASAEAGVVTLDFLSNVECKAVIPDSAKSWISVAPETRAMERKSIVLKLESNTGYYRSATVTVQSLDGTLKLEYQVEQDGVLGTEIDPNKIPDNEIWYVMSTGKNVAKLSNWPVTDAKIVEHVYEHGRWIIRYDKKITEFSWRSITTNSHDGSVLTNLYLPNSIESIDYLPEGSNINIKEFYVPKNLKKIPGFVTSNLNKFTGHNISEDGKCIIIDGKLLALAGYRLEEYEIPNNVVSIGEYAIAYNEWLKKIIIPEGVLSIEHNAFCSHSYLERTLRPVPISQLEEVYLPSTLTHIGVYVFSHQSKIKKFYGNCKFISDDGYSLIIDNYNNNNLKFMVSFASGAGLTSYEIPEGVEGIESYCFYYAETLKELTFPGSLIHIASSCCFKGTYNIEKIYGPNVTDDNRSLVIDGTLRYVAPKGLKEYTTPSGVTILAKEVLSRKPELESVTISDEVVAVEDDYLGCSGTGMPLGYILQNNPNLKTVTISANMRILGMDPFGCGSNYGLDDSKNIRKVYLRATIPPLIGNNYPKNIPSLFPKLTIYVPEESLETYMVSAYWAPYKGYIKGYKYTDLPKDSTDIYISSDYSKDGIVTTLQTATQGNGIDIVLMGDAYSDRQIEDGTYKTDMENLYNNLFTEEPYKSFKDYFNVYYVNIVSATEGYEYGSTALGGYFGVGTQVGGNDKTAFNYALNAIPEHRMDEATLIVAMNSDNYAGTCYMYHPENNTGYGNGVSVSYFPKGGNATTLAQLLHHEACGHGFAKLADEYAYENMGSIPSDSVSEIQTQQNNWGWFKNVDFTSDPVAIRWSRFINDTRYTNEGLGAYEGGLTYWTGVWRPTENSIMRNNTGGFNAPSREAIYYRIHKLAYGERWEYDYEEFVEWDAVNRTAESQARRQDAKWRAPMKHEPTTPPVIVKKAWRDALQKN